MTDPFGQGDYQLRLDWGPIGAQAVRAEVAVVVDVLSFSTTVCIAVERGTRVYPFRWHDGRAQAFADEHGAVLAVGRLESVVAGGARTPSLSPSGLLSLAPMPDRLVLPSPNGSTIAVVLQHDGARVVIGSLRNADAVAHWLAPQLGRDRSVALIAAGERWGGDGSLRPALEDQLGAGAILSALVSGGHGDRMSPEALAAVGLFESGRGRLREWLRDCAGGRELCARGFRSDVDVAAELNASQTVPVLVDGAFVVVSDGQPVR
ncbi:2-phosphosulfolactate phosphatase [Leekyejoonella antrihumi]|uniref:Probable 2-phosphosulfolactate phosphatase n=1 Tax=Leekyejoonella antrihumi TaxID=1660198 RepID=A0A563E3N0_9MICO|nr:2-phosphosulfolactate phosphatase [Leekyejoonella antrihumi]TWP36832.1 2-phosphosulfolactate phosphatase [Leekyejoonella antrihumi]